MKHVWVALQYTMIDVEVKEDGEMNWSVTEAADELGREDAVAGCWVCEVPLNHDTYNTECSGPADESTPPK